MSQRAYNSVVRRRQADETRRTIADAAEHLFLDNGYEVTTIGAIAAAAGVAPQTVYAVFGSKKGLLTALMERYVQVQDFAEPYDMALRTDNPRTAISHIVGIVCQIFLSMGQLHEMLRGSVATSPELRQLLRERQTYVRGMQEEFVRHLHCTGALRPDFNFDTALDTYWCLLSRESYRLLVEEQGWTAERFQGWLTDLISRMLLREPLQ